jgi:acyl-coenzyme A synthetase/AMP-(fatty) acid ligase
VPDSFSFRREPLPRNANGKVMKRQLREELLAGADPACVLTATRAPRVAP